MFSKNVFKTSVAYVFAEYYRTCVHTSVPFKFRVEKFSSYV